MRIGLNSLIGDGFGNGSFVFGEVPSGGGGSGFPPEGFESLLEGVIYPVAQGGEETEVIELSYSFPNQICDVERWHDGTGGFYTNWSTVSNIQYSFAVFYTSEIVTQSPVEMPAPYEGNYYDSEYKQPVYTWDGTGSYNISGDTFGYFAYGTIVTNNHDQAVVVEVPMGSEVYYDSGKYDTWEWDGSGNIQALNNQGTYFANGVLIESYPQETEVPTGSESYSGNGKFTVYKWNGSGGYTSATEGSFYANNTEIYTVDIQTEVPSASGNYFNDGTTTIYKWNGSGGYTSTGGGAYYPYGTYITSDGEYDHYWNGSGGYYSEPL
jgi:hypothetical protein